MFFFILQSVTSNAQTVVQKPLIEVFTSSTCGPCVEVNQNIDKILKDFEGQYSLIKYQMDFPSQGDIYYTEQGGVRRDFYGVVGIPDMFINANENSPSEFTKATVEQLLTQVTEFEISVYAKIEDYKTLSVTTEINPLADFSSGLKLFTVLVEKKTVGNHSINNEKEFHNVMMAMMPDAYGLDMDSFIKDTKKTFSNSLDISNTNVEEPDDLAIIVFIQDANNQILQSQMVDVEAINCPSYTCTLNFKDKQGEPIKDVKVLLKCQVERKSNANGQILYAKIFPGKYQYIAETIGFIKKQDSITIGNENFSTIIELESPSSSLYYEPFDYSEVPSDWTAIYDSDNLEEVYMAWSKSIVLYKETGDNDMWLISPEIDLSKGKKILLEVGEGYGEIENPKMVIGTVPAPDQIDKFEELLQYFPLDGMFEWIEIDIENKNITNKHLAFKYEGTGRGWWVIETINITGSASSSVIDVLDVERINVYPNPVDNIINLNFNSFDNCSIDIFNLFGQKVKHFDTNSRSIIVNDLIPGCYCIKVFSNNQIYSSMFIKK